MTQFVHDFFLPGTQLTFPAERGRADREGAGGGVGLERPRARRRAPGGDGAEDRRQDQGRRPAGPGRPADHAADGGGVREDAGLPRQGRGHRSAAAGRRPRSARVAGRADRAAASAGAAPAAVAVTGARSASACPRGCSASARRSRRRSRRCSRWSTRRRRTSRAPPTRSRASIWRRRESASSPRLSSRAAGSSTPSDGAGAHEALARQLVREPAGPEGRVEARSQRHRLHGRRSRAPAARRPDGRRLRRAAAAPGAGEPEEHRQRRCSSVRRRCLGRRGAEADRDAVSAGAGREREAGRRLDQRLARRRCQPLEAARDGARGARCRGRLPARRPPDALVGGEAGARARHAQGARLDAVARRAPGRRRIARAGGARRPARRRARDRSSPCRSGRSARR